MPALLQRADSIECLFLAQSERLAEAPHSGHPDVGATSDAAQKAEDAAKMAAKSGKEATQKAMEAIRDAAKKAMEATRDAADKALEVTKETARNVGNAMKK